MRSLFLTEHSFCAAIFLLTLLHVFIVSFVLADFSELSHTRSSAADHRRHERRHHASRLIGRRESHHEKNDSDFILDRPRQQRQNGRHEYTQTTRRQNDNSRRNSGMQPRRRDDSRSQDSAMERRQPSQVYNRPHNHEESGRRNTPDGHPLNPTFDFDKNCTACWTREYARHRRVEAMKISILQKLGLKAPPNITVRNLPNIPPLAKYIMDYGMTNDEPASSSPRDEEDLEEDDHSVTKRIIILSQTAPDRLGVPRHGVSYFEFQPDLGPSRIHRAQFSVFVKRPPEGSPTTAWIKIFKIRKSDGRLNKILVKTRKLHLDRNKGGSWITFDFTKLVQNWVKNPRLNYGLFVNATTPNVVVDPESEHEASYKPYLDILLKNKKARRLRRTPGRICDMQSEEERCCRYPLVIDFVEFGWDWIIAPKRFRANFCSGECPYLFQPSFIHSVVLSQHFPVGVKGPCCSPRKLNPISLVYYDQDVTIKLGTLAGMIVEKCGCS